jgi:hypothetical protein
MRLPIVDGFSFAPRSYPRLGWMKDHVVKPIVAMDAREALLHRQRPRQPLEQAFNFWNVLFIGGVVLLVQRTT